MEASGAGLEVQDTAALAGATSGNGIVVIVGMFDPNDIVSLVERGPQEVRAGAGGKVDERVVDADGQVGFAGLEPGGEFFACGYNRGRWQEVRCVAQDPALGLTLFQPPAQAAPTQLGTSSIEAPPTPAEPPSTDLEVGLPAEVESPLLSEDAPATGVAPEGGPVADEEAAEADPAAEAPVDPAVPPADTPAAPDAGPVVDAPADLVDAGPVVADAPADLPTAAPVDAAPADPAPVADAPADVPAETATDAPVESSSSADSFAGDAPLAPADPAAPAEPTAAAGVPAESGAETAVEPAPVASDAGEQPADVPVPDAPAEVDAPTGAAQTPLELLVAQAGVLGIEGAAGSTDEAWLRQAITEKNVTPVA